MENKLISFNQLRGQLIKSTNKVSFIVDIFKGLHPEAPPEDFKELGGRIAGIIKQARGEYLLVLQAIWKSSADGIIGSHLNYIQGILRRNSQGSYLKQPTQLPSSDEIEKSIKGFGQK